MKALIIDHDKVEANLIASTLSHAGFQVSQVHNGEAALRRWSDERPQLTVAAVNLPRLDGFAICRHIRQQADGSIIFLIGPDEEEAIIRGFQAGADDYLLKSFRPRPFVARAQAMLRRVQTSPTPTIRQVGKLRLDPAQRELWWGQGRGVTLTPLENRLLDYLMLNAGHILTLEAIIDHVWRGESGNRYMVRQLVRRLRGKIAQAVGQTVLDKTTPDEAKSIHTTYIEAIPGLGYGFNLVNR